MIQKAGGFRGSLPENSDCNPGLLVANKTSQVAMQPKFTLFFNGVAQLVGAGVNVLSFGRFQNADGFAAALA